MPFNFLKKTEILIHFQSFSSRSAKWKNRRISSNTSQFLRNWFSEESDPFILNIACGFSVATFEKKHICSMFELETVQKCINLVDLEKMLKTKCSHAEIGVDTADNGLQEDTCICIYLYMCDILKCFFKDFLRIRLNIPSRIAMRISVRHGDYMFNRKLSFQKKQLKLIWIN